MPTNYPAGLDAFGVPSLPEETPLSSAGDSTRAHTPLLRDLGDALEAVQVHAAQRGHDHSGDGTDPKKGAKLLQINTHQGADTDTANGIHHTIGPGPFQVAPGNHTHDYDGPSILNAPFKLCTSTDRPTPVPGMVIYERDTKRFRQWELHANNVVISGLNVIYNFDTVSTLTIGGGGWNVNYTSGNTSNGVMATPDGSLRWIDNGNNTNVGWAKRTGPEDNQTQTDDQVITWKTGDDTVQPEGLIIDDGATNDFYFRVSSDEQSYIRLRVGYNYLKVFYTTSGRNNEKFLGEMGDVEADLANTEWRAQMVDRTLSIYRAGQHMGSVVDSKFATLKGSNNRGWMIGMQAGQQILSQTTPGEIEWLRVQDLRYYASTNRWTLLNLGQVPTVRLRQGIKQRLLTTGTILEWNTEVEDNFGYFDKNVSRTDIIAKEPGLYRIDMALQWDPETVPDVGHVIVLVNGLETEIRDSKYLRGNSFTPGFSQVLSLSAPIRLAENDVVTVKALYRPRNNIIDPIFSWLDGPSRVDSRLELTFQGV